MQPEAGRLNGYINRRIGGLEIGKRLLQSAIAINRRIGGLEKAQKLLLP